MKCSGKEWDSCRVEKMGCTGCHYSESKEMFEELGYKIKRNDDDCILYINNSDKCICFYLRTKEFACFNYYDGHEYVTMQELRTIHLKCRELGWYK